ncbi:cell wall hydrolase [Hyphobacterium sp. HN65]|uniref:Cell wall hydrolase n=1 Tax=Hyphobacterium lacteum TaxID=3116575 RepID=A0ABU7LMW7_9PROT|nr:cell wall hydrolase [Hyphobacterium sp. HN65]MEE2525261.1 cell wall hydrolase [Hyphobacterium sp. HN65]
MSAMKTNRLTGRWPEIARGGFAVACLVLFAALLPMAGMRASVQNDAAYWQELAQRHIEADDLLGWSAPYGLKAASLSVASDELEGARVLMRPISEDLRTFDASHITRARFSAAEVNCLAEAVYYESRGESFSGQAAVAEVVMNRVNHRVYPDTICGVVYEGSERTTGCQFSFTCDGSMDRAPRGRAWRRSQLVAEHVALGFAPPRTRRATHYHTTAVDPHWNDSLVQTGQIGTHVFYRFPNRRERQEMRERESNL